MNEPIITQMRSYFSLTCKVAVNIRENAESVWGLLTDAKGFPCWNSTITSIEGEIREGQQIRLRVPGSDRAFTPKVSDVVQNERMIWIGGFAPLFKGVRTFELRPCNDGSTEFTMQERFTGVMLPLIQGKLPDFGPVFARFASDLKNAAEQISLLRA